MTKPRAQSSNPLDDEAERVSAPISPLVKWRKERREYEDTIRNRAKGETDDLIVPIKNIFDEGMLRQWCRLRWEISMSDVPDDLNITEVAKIISSVKNNTVPDIDHEMAEHLCMDLSESDVDERVIQYFKLLLTIMGFFTEERGKTQLYPILIKSLEPKALREEVDRTARFQTHKARGNEVTLHDLILEKAPDHEKAYQSNRRAKRERDSERPPARTNGPRTSTKGTFDRPKKPPTPCPHCDDLHWLSECTSAIDTKKAEIRKILCAQRSDSPKTNTGADRTAVSKKHFEELMLRDPAVKLIRLSTPMLIVGVAEHEIVCSASVQVRGSLNTAAGAVAIHELVKCLVIDDDEPEFILGQDQLRTLGIGIDRQLEQLAERDSDDGEEIADSDVGVPVSDTPPTGGNHQLESPSDGDLHEAVEMLVQDVIKHRFPNQLEEWLRAIATKHDIWLIELGNDSQARVEPLEIRLKKERKQSKASHGSTRMLCACTCEILTASWSIWASPVLPVRKPGTTDNQYRQTYDYRLVNDLVEALISTMPHMSALLEYTKGKKHYGLFDLLKGFWQLPLAKLSQELMSYITDSKIYTPRRVPQGCCDATVHFSRQWRSALSRFGTSVLLSELMIYNSLPMILLEQFFDLVASFGLKLSAKKSGLYQKSVK
ncbi:hypothetical protein PHMEG_00017094 [Phytophthora megakarya]|uniref:Reverse transcriptase domain-containing protein n=1 Tax=Phytophthora megakarya TaxID=4795 RepID=A0A225VZ85_9STRA|nr:hypothetical protein PHMEG_00017094 [Phytophthora megakarya]